MLETITNLIDRFLNSGLLSTVMLLVRVITPFLALYVVWRCYTSFKKGQRRKDPVILLEDAATGTRFPVLYWENSIGRSRSCDIQIPDESVSRDHAVLMRREEGWFVCDTGSHLGTRVRNREISEPTLVEIGDKIKLGSTTLILRNADESPKKKRRIFTGFSKEAASPFKLMMYVTLVQISMTLQLMLGTGKFQLTPAAPFAILFLAGWTLYFFSRRVLKRVSFEIETVALLLSSIGILLLSGEGLDAVKMQIAAFLIGIVLFCFLVWFMSDLERVMKVRLYIAIAAILLFAVNLVLGKEIYGSKNWIIIGPVSFQPSELIKIAFVFVGASTLDRLQTKKNIMEFIVFAAICLACLFIMRDFGTALIFFACFLII
ncbi:MAG: FtsW/RodA/SpoVE family cell cycle protein, partial [Hominenteromicrobium sp.]